MKITATGEPAAAAHAKRQAARTLLW
jgi:hypothetical protein